MEGTIRTMTQRQGAYSARHYEAEWCTAGALVILICMAVFAGWLLLSAPVPTDPEAVRMMVGR